MNANSNQNSNYTPSQLMITAAAREIVDGEVVFVGMRLPLLGFLLAKSTHAPAAIGVYELGIIRDTVAPEPILTMGDLPNLNRAQWLADTAEAMGLLQQGRVDVSFIGGAQVDRFGNLNTSYIGGFQAMQTRLPGSGGACDLACLGQRHIIVMNHQKRRFVHGWTISPLPVLVTVAAGVPQWGCLGEDQRPSSPPWASCVLTRIPVK